jgi:hypothetical protein
MTAWVWRHAAGSPVTGVPDFSSWWRAVSRANVPPMLARLLEQSVVSDADEAEVAALPSRASALLTPAQHPGTAIRRRAR